MKILVTGGGGYLGCHLVPLLLERGHEVRIFDRFCFGEDAIAAFAGSKGLEIVRGDIRRLQEFPDLLRDVDAVAHLAGLANDPSCDLNPDMTLDVNVESTRELINQAVQRGVRRFVLASSCSVYGHGVFEYLDELSPLNPVSAYASSKIEAEKILFGMQSEQFEPVAARMATLFGWSPRMRFDLAVNQMTATAARKGVINVMGGGNQWRPFLHVHDAARAFAHFLEAPAEHVSGEAFNVGDDRNNVRILALAEMVNEFFPNVPLDVSPDDEDRRTYRVQFKKLAEKLHFVCEKDIAAGVREIQQALANNSIDPFADEYFNVRRMKSLLSTPVAEGGEPIVPRFIPLSKPTLAPEEEAAVLETMRSGWVTSGPHVPAFEKTFAKTVGADESVGVISCTAALHLCMIEAGVKAGDDVVMSPLTWPSVGNTVINMGARVVFADVDTETLNVTPETIEAALTEKTKCIIPVHMAGEPVDIEGIYALGRERGIPIIEDAAHALGASRNGKPIGSHGDLACFSFYAIKNITTFEGGAVALRDPEAASRLRRLAAHGMTGTAWERYGRSAVPAPAEVVEPGYKYAMGNVAAAMGLAQLKKFREFMAARRRLAGLYRLALQDVDEVRLQAVKDPREHGWHLMIIRFELDKLTKSRNEIAHLLRQENVGTGFHFYGLHLHQYYREALGWKPEDLPSSTRVSNEVLSLPLFPGMTDRNVNEVVAALKKVLAYARKRG